MEREHDDAPTAQEELGEVTAALDALTAALDDDSSLDAALQFVCRQVINVVPGADMASVMRVRDGDAQTVACTDAVVFGLDADQYAFGEGPCLDAAATGQILKTDAESARHQWPEFTRRAEAAGVASFLSAPLFIDEQCAGALNLYGRHDHGYRDLDAALLELYLASVEAVLRATARYIRARKEADNLRVALASRAVIDQAKGIIMSTRGIDADQAFAVLVQQSQRENIKVRELAERFVAAVIQSERSRRPRR